MQTQSTNTKISGVVTNRSSGQYTVSHDGKSTLCSLSARLWKDINSAHQTEASRHGSRNNSSHKTDPLAIGDCVTFIPADDRAGMIINIAPRRNWLSRRTARPMPGAHAFEQVIAANIDQVVPIFAVAEPAPAWHLLDRYLVTAESYELPSIIVITKYDLLKDPAAERALQNVVERYQHIGYPVILTSAVNQQGLDELCQAMLGRTSVLVGKSGVGKTTLLNMLEPDLGLRVQAVNTSTGKGRHTTTHLEMFTLARGGAIIDTPGTREFGLWGLTPEEIAQYFPEMRPLLGLCKFGLSCQHDEEPGCAIRAAVMTGEISPYRYKSYLRLRADM
jgi:ribosome biogenesis GTPase